MLSGLTWRDVLRIMLFPTDVYAQRLRGFLEFCQEHRWIFFGARQTSTVSSTLLIALASIFEP